MQAVGKAASSLPLIGDYTFLPGSYSLAQPHEASGWIAHVMQGEESKNMNFSFLSSHSKSDQGTGPRWLLWIIQIIQ